MSWKQYISQTVGPESLANINSFITPIPNSTKSAIDIFYEGSRRIIRNTPATINPSDWEGVSLAVAIISLTENYFRTILGNILSLCPIVQKNSADNNINFGSVLWHPTHQVQRGAFEHVSFSDSKRIAEITKKYIGVDVGQIGLSSILSEFSKVCEIRHAIVHSGRILAGKNALMLNIPSNTNSIQIQVGYGQLQSIAAVCTTLVVSYNQALYELMCTRWATSWRQQNFCTSSNENELIKKIWFIFYSAINFQDGTIPSKGSWIKCRNELKREFNITA